MKLKRVLDYSKIKHRLYQALAVVLSSCLMAAVAKNIDRGHININTASKYELTLLPGIGEATAQKILHARRQQAFDSSQDLLTRQLVRPQYFRDLEPLVVVSGEHNYTDPNQSRLSKQSFSDKNWTINLNTQINDVRSLRLLTDRAFKSQLFERVEQAKQRVWLSSFAFKATRHPENSIKQLINLLIKKVNKGIAVHFVLEQSDYHRQLSAANQRLAKRLVKAGIQVYFDSPKNTQHSKLVIVDGRWVFVGSHNLTHSALNRNHEVSLLVDSVTLAMRLEEYLQQIAAESVAQ